MRYPALDGLRGMAIAAVLAHNLQFPRAPESTLGRLVEMSLDRGWIGVQLFFVLSGFLITGILLDSQKASNYFSSFFARRALRIFPLYYLSLIVLTSVLPAIGATSPQTVPTLPQQLPYWLYISNWTQPNGFDGGLLSHFWSLAVEEQFYLLWPFLIRRCTPRSALRLCVAVAVTAFIVRTTMLYAGANPLSLYMFSVCRMDALALGGAVAAALRIESAANWLRGREVPILVASVSIILIGAAVTRGYPRLSALDQTVGYSLLALSLALLVLAAAQADSSHTGGVFAVFRSRLLLALGKYSYAIYILHKPLQDLIGTPVVFQTLLPPAYQLVSTFVYFISALAICLILGAFSYRFVETPFLRLKARFSARLPIEPDRPWTVLVDRAGAPMRR